MDEVKVGAEVLRAWISVLTNVYASSIYAQNRHRRRQPRQQRHQRQGTRDVDKRMSTVAPIFKRPRNNAERSTSSVPPSSDPFQPVPSSILNRQPRQQSPATFLPVQIELSHFRPIAFRIFTKKHNLTLKSDALAVLAEYIGRKCGSEWRILGEPILDEVARAWARAEGITVNILANGRFKSSRGRRIVDSRLEDFGSSSYCAVHIIHVAILTTESFPIRKSIRRFNTYNTPTFQRNRSHSILFRCRRIYAT
jgi:hypothetical protein